MDMPSAVDKDGNVILADAGSISGEPIRMDEDAHSIASSSKHSVQSFSYGPDSLRAALPGKAGLPVFQDEAEEEKHEMTELETRVQEARNYLNTEEKKNVLGGHRRVKFDVAPSDFDAVSEVVKKKAEDEYTRAERELRRKRNDVSMVRHNTYMDQARRVPRSFEETRDIRRKKDAPKEVYTKPDVESLLELVGGDERMTNLPGLSGVKLRSLLAHRALQVKDKVHKSAVNKKIASPKKFSLVDHYIAPIWRENVRDSDEDDSDDEEERAIKAQEKAERKAERKAKAEAILEERNAAEDAMKLNMKTVKRTDIKIEDAMGKPRTKVQLTKVDHEV